MLPGYDFISNAAAANDGNGRDADASDAGDWVTQQEVEPRPIRRLRRERQLVARHPRRGNHRRAHEQRRRRQPARTWSPWILPVRVLGKCGGLDSDILEAMAWAGGIHVDGVPDNPYPAKIENMSLGSFGPCGAAYASVIAQLAARGVLVVASAGNEGGPVGVAGELRGCGGASPGCGTPARRWASRAWARRSRSARRAATA